MNDHQCRRCQRAREATNKEIEFGRVVCWWCGGTCDPTDRELRRQAVARLAFGHQGRPDCGESELEVDINLEGRLWKF